MPVITVTAFKWVPKFAQGQVRDHRVRWILNEAGWPYEVRLIDLPTQASAVYRAGQPFGQVPVMEEDGRPTLFESGAIVLDVAMRSSALWPDEPLRGPALSWYFAALNSLEPALMNVAEVAFFVRDEAAKAQRRPGVEAFARQRLGELEAALGGRDWLVGDAFGLADLMTASVLRIAESTGLLAAYPKLAAYQARCFARPAYQAAIEAQMAAFAAHGPADMGYVRG